MSKKLTWHDVKVYGAGMLAGMGIFWGAMQYNQHKISEENKIPKIETTINGFGATIKNVSQWNPKKQNREIGEELTLFNLKDSSIAIRAQYYDGDATTIELKKIEENKLVNVQKLDSIYFELKNKTMQTKWLANYDQNKKRWRNTYKVQCDTLIRSKYGTEYAVSDYTGDGEFDNITAFGNHPGHVTKLYKQRDSAEFHKTLNKLMNQK